MGEKCWSRICDGYRCYLRSAEFLQLYFQRPYWFLTCASLTLATQIKLHYQWLHFSSLCACLAVFQILLILQISIIWYLALQNFLHVLLITPFVTFAILLSKAFDILLTLERCYWNSLIGGFFSFIDGDIKVSSYLLQRHTKIQLATNNRSQL